MHTRIICFSISLLLTKTTWSQSFDQLKQLNSNAVKVYYSKGFSERTGIIAKRTESALQYHEQLLGFRPTITLLVLSKNDWQSYTNFPVYGMPHYNDRQTLFVAAEDNEFWKSFLPPLEQLPAGLRTSVEKVYRNSRNEISMEPFFDLLAIHELGHAFHIQGGLTMQRKWMGELFSNILLHTYIAETEPNMLPALTIFPEMVIAAGTKGFQYTSLNDIEDRYDEIGQQHARNYGWYQCRWHKAAANIYYTHGKSICKTIWNALLMQKQRLNDEELIQFFETSGAGTIAAMIKSWERETIK
jgi:hypothetical protein